MGDYYRINDSSHESASPEDSLEGAMSVDDRSMITRVSLIIAICTCAFCVLGIYGNIVSIVIFTHRLMRSPIDVLLAGLSAIDLVLVVSAVLAFVIPSINNCIGSMFLYSIYQFTSLVVYPVTMMAQTSSIWTFVLVSVERYLAVCKPLKRHKLLTYRQAKLAQVTVVALAFSYNVIRFWELKPSSTQVDSIDYFLRYNEFYVVFYYTSLYVLTHFLIPFGALLTLNVLIIRTLRRSPVNLGKIAGKHCQQRKITQMIIVITTMFALTNTLAFAINLWEAFNRQLFISGPWLRSAFLCLEISNFLVVFNSSTTFLLYLRFCRKYRLLFVSYIRCRRPHLDRRLVISRDDSIHSTLICTANTHRNLADRSSELPSRRLRSEHSGDIVNEKSSSRGLEND